LEQRTIRIEALTPLWTGGPGQTCDARMFETGLMGSLRWWFEACARSAGIAAADPTNAATLKYDPKHENLLEPVSRVFGCTGWRRRFRLVICDRQPLEIPREVEIDTEWHRGPKGQTNKAKWYYGRPLSDRPGPVRAWGSFNLKIVQIAPWTEYDGTSTDLLLDLIRFVSRYGMMCAKPQLGLGVVKLPEDGVTDGFPALKDWLDRRRGSAPPDDPDLPSLDDFLYLECPVLPRQDGEREDPDGWRSTFKWKYQFRSRYKVAPTWETFRHTLAGYTRPLPIRSKVFISHPYGEGEDRAHRVVAWLPGNLRDAFAGLPKGQTDMKGTLEDDVKAFFLKDATERAIWPLSSKL
jgi:CRISPR-associated protein Cmr1